MRTSIRNAKKLNLGVALAAVMLLVVAKKGKSFSVEASFAVAGTTYQIADDAGKVKIYKDVDTFIADAMVHELIDGDTEFKFGDVETLAPAPYFGDYLKKNQATIVSYAALKAKAMEKVAALTLEIASFVGNPTIPAVVVQAKTDAKASVAADVLFYTESIATLTAAVTPSGGQ
jgi:hypothetical protein